jgi:hypothetical protein
VVSNVVHGLHFQHGPSPSKRPVAASLIPSPALAPPAAAPAAQGDFKPNAAASLQAAPPPLRATAGPEARPRVAVDAAAAFAPRPAELAALLPETSVVVLAAVAVPVLLPAAASPAAAGGGGGDDDDGEDGVAVWRAEAEATQPRTLAEEAARLEALAAADQGARLCGLPGADAEEVSLPPRAQQAAAEVRTAFCAPANAAPAASAMMMERVCAALADGRSANCETSSVRTSSSCAARTAFDTSKVRQKNNNKS